jgi:LPXTG-site transpeptidase (sortase) family protein
MIPFLAAGLLAGLLTGGMVLQRSERSMARGSRTLGLFAPLYLKEPARIEIPKLGIDAAIIPVGRAPDGSMETAHNEHDVAWYEHGAIPGTPGAAVLAGHLDTRISREAVFYDLHMIEPGDEVRIADKEGRTAVFRVREKRLYERDDPAAGVFASDGKSRLNLITCAGDWLPQEKSYSKRLVVFTEKIE